MKLDENQNAFLLSFSDRLTGLTEIYRRVSWPGGRGLLLVDNLSCTGSAEIVVHEVQVWEGFNFGWNITPPALSLGGVSSITTSGAYFVELPPCNIIFFFNVPTGDELNLEKAMLVKM